MEKKICIILFVVAVLSLIQVILTLVMYTNYEYKIKTAVVEAVDNKIEEVFYGE